MAISRVLVDELLDDLPQEDPSAQRSRKDLVGLNALMGNFRWVENRIARYGGRMTKDPSDPLRIVEIGAGEGRLGRRLARRFPRAEILGIDRAPAPADAPTGLSWKQEDLFRALPNCRGDVLVGVLILHHFEEDELRTLQTVWANFRVLYFAEPWRSSWTLALAGLANPWVGKVTRHDMPASIRAGFVPGELSKYLGLTGWKVRESIDLRGMLRLEAWRP